ncbi:hypothetical protein CHS0354_038949 [Potamilus streckersoni]|uniref:Uncharacterized protein n=1 Tax=Potamilus streckersoni TaxID=2493646 RepID=A0AAE0VMQ6_9BIVA|nr:hypothetical protein CHS0354_038949 [Potamilus streckersoni]
MFTKERLNKLLTAASPASRTYHKQHNYRDDNYDHDDNNAINKPNYNCFEHISINASNTRVNSSIFSSSNNIFYSGYISINISCSISYNL